MLVLAWKMSGIRSENRFRLTSSSEVIIGTIERSLGTGRSVIGRSPGPRVSEKLLAN
jgi:hypothetical protein